MKFASKIKDISGLRRSAQHSLLLLILAAAPRVTAQTVPADPEATCIVSATEFDSWFQSGAAALNGVVNPANSVTFPNTPNCSFYKWSEQMFLWLTSPKPPIYGGGGGHIFESSSFYDVSPPDANGGRTFIPHKTGLARNLFVMAKQKGPNGLSLIRDKQGKKFEVEPPSKEPQPLRVLSTAGTLTEISDLKLGADGKKVFLDREGKAIEPRMLPVLPQKTPQIRELVPPQVARAKKFILKDISVFLDAAGNVIDVEQGQAFDGEVLIAQNGSLIYYALAVNDVFAYYRTMLGASVPPNTLFPTTQQELNAITTFAASHGKTLVDPAALAVEVKSSWIEATGLQESDYITMTTTVPTYDKTDPNKWVPNGKKTVKLAMVGMHVVGSANGHPEMIWATFEHIANAPNAAYSYVNSGGNSTSIAQDTSGSWLFCANNSTGPFNQPRNKLETNASGNFTGNIIAGIPGTPIGPDNVIRWKAWGAAANQAPNPLVSTARSNSELISINNSVRSKLVNGDVRRNYIMTGATWMIAGTFPFTNFNTTEVGTSKMNNSTMETFTQGSSNGDANNTFNCFDCHGGKTTSVSHIFSDLKPLSNP